MASKSTLSLSENQRISAPGQQSPRAHAQLAHSLPVFEFSFDVQPVMSIIRRHVKLSKDADKVITQELIDMLSRTTVLSRTADQTRATHTDDSLLTTEQAAQLVNVSRPYMVKLIDSGVVKLHQKVGKQRRVLRSAVLQWQRTERMQQTKALRRLSEDLDEEIFQT